MNAIQNYDTFAQKIADVTHIPYVYVVQGRDMGLWNIKQIRDRLIRHDYWKMMNTNKFSEKQVLLKLSGMYNINIASVVNIIRQKAQNTCYCRECGAIIARSVHIRNDGLCDKCITRRQN